MVTSATSRPTEFEHGRLSGLTVIYGGSFDPPHMGHQMACLYLLEALAADEVWLMPTFCHAFGKGLAAFSSRFEMCQQMAAPFGRRVTTSRLEEELGGQSRTYETLSHLRRAHPQRQFALAVGADLVAELPRWYRWTDIASSLPVVVVGRSGYPLPDTLVELPAISSVEVRSRIEAGRPVGGMLPAQVADTILAHSLYPRPKK